MKIILRETIPTIDIAKEHYDRRNIKNGYEIPGEGYCDQPYVVVRRDGCWVCVLTTGSGYEGGKDQHIVSTVSADCGKTWSALTDIEPPGPPESSWAMPLITPSGRIYVFYTYNRENIREISTNLPGIYSKTPRVDTLGSYAYKFSDDGGASWSANRYYIDVRSFKIDRGNSLDGKVHFFWGVGKPVAHEGSVYIGFSKVGMFGKGFMETDEGAFLKSTNILTETDPEKIHWETLPDGDIGLRSPIGTIADEQNLTSLSDGSLYCTYRTLSGYCCHAYSRDGGHNWTPPEFAAYSPGGKKIKHPRAANFVRKCSNGKYTLWFHNHGKNQLQTPDDAYQHRNPAWLCGGIEKDGYIYWSQPEIVLYEGDDPNVRISYPDFIETDGRYFITETQKEIARVHEIDSSLLEGLWNQFDNRILTQKGLLLFLKNEDIRKSHVFKLSEMPSVNEGGLSIDFWIKMHKAGESTSLLTSGNPDGAEFSVRITENMTAELTMCDGQHRFVWQSDAGLLSENKWHHISIIADGGPCIVMMLIDGILCDGGEQRQFGWGRFEKELSKVFGDTVSLQCKDTVEIGAVRLYGCALRTSESVGNYQSEKDSYCRVE